MPHFGRTTPVGMYVKQLLVCFHGGYLRLDKSYDITVKLVSAIIGLPRQGIDPALCLHKEGEKLDKNDMKSKYQLGHDGKGFLLSSINDVVVRSATKILCSKVLHKMRPT